MTKSKANELTKLMYHACANAMVMYRDGGKDIVVKKEEPVACGECLICQTRIAFRELFVEYTNAMIKAGETVEA